MEMQEVPPVMKEDSEGDTNLCFVCMGPNAPPSQCACTDRHVHVDCMMQWLKQKNTNTCPVCKEAYPHVGFKVKTRVRPACNCWTAFCGFICFSTLVVCGSIQIYIYFNSDFVQIKLTLALGILMLALAALGLLICLLFGRFSSRENFRLCERVSRKTVVLQAVSSV